MMAGHGGKGDPSQLFLVPILVPASWLGSDLVLTASAVTVLPLSPLA